MFSSLRRCQRGKRIKNSLFTTNKRTEAGPPALHSGALIFHHQISHKATRAFCGAQSTSQTAAAVYAHCGFGRTKNEQYGNWGTKSSFAFQSSRNWQKKILLRHHNPVDDFSHLNTSRLVNIINR
jgi:hypothetical protein